MLLVHYLLYNLFLSFTLSLMHSYQGLLDSRGLMSSNYLQQEAALFSLSTLMSILPGETYAEFEKVLFCKAIHDTLIFRFVFMFNSCDFFGST